MKKIKEMFQSPQSRYGTYSMVITAVVIAIVIVINIIAGQLPDSMKSVDLSGNSLYEITKTSKKLLKNLDKEVQIHVLAEKSSTDERIQTFIEKYAALSNKVKVDWVDPVLHPSAVTEYEAQENSVVVECKDTEKKMVIPFTDIIVYDEMSYYTTGSMTESEFDAEGQLTSAINYVTSDASKTIYRTTGHGESTFSTTITDLMGKSNFTISELNLMMNNKIPDDCDLLVLYAPTSDLTADEKTLITDYLTNGGKVLFIMGDTQNETPNLDALMKTYGMEKVDGYIADTTRCYQGNPYYIFPEITASGEMADGLSSKMVLLINALGFNTADPERDTITVDSFMTTSSNGYAVTEDKETQGTYTLGAVATEDESRFTVISAATMIDANVTDSFSTLENTTLFMNAVTSNFDDVDNLSIEAKSLETTFNTMQHTGLLGLAAIIGVPVLIVIFGFVRWLKRRKA